jgi:hypothetical protein
MPTLNNPGRVLQMNAIRSGLDGSAINLVQGPPGTGKTKTILGILSIIMHSVPPDAMDVFSQVTSLPQHHSAISPPSTTHFLCPHSPLTHTSGPDLECGSQMSQSTATVDPKDAQRLWLRLSSYVVRSIFQ